MTNCDTEIVMRKTQSTGAIVSFFAAASVFSPAFAKQCIWNKAGFYIEYKLDPKRKYREENQISLGQGNCSDDNFNYTVVLSIKDGKLASDFARVFATAAAAALGVVEGPAAAGGAVGLAALADKGIPDAQEIFYTGVPRSDRYLDVWGTVWSPQTGYGGPIH